MRKEDKQKWTGWTRPGLRSPDAAYSTIAILNIMNNLEHFLHGYPSTSGAQQKALKMCLSGGMVCKFADDTTIGGGMDSEEDYFRVQMDLDLMRQWTKEWQMELDLDK
eukprot:g30337.t1